MGENNHYSVSTCKHDYHEHNSHILHTENSKLTNHV